MTTNVLQDIISRCHHRHEQPLKQRRTTSTPRRYKGHPYHLIIYCAYRYPVMVQDLEAANIAFLPIGQAPVNDHPPRNLEREPFLKYRQTPPWDAIRWHRSWGIQVYTGMPSARDGAPWHDIDFTYEAICAAPDAVLACVQALVDTAGNPLLTLSKSGGLRFSCRIPDYLHPNTKQARLYVYKQAVSAAQPNPHEVYLEISGDGRDTCWDARHEILMGDLLDPPVIPKEVLFAPLDALRAVLHDPVPQNLLHEEDIPEAPYSLGSRKLDLAKEAFFKHGFSYLREEDGFHYWSRQGAEVSVSESEGDVWVRAATAGAGLPTEATLITDVWNDTGILPPLPETGPPVDDKVRTVQEDGLSPISIKRPKPILHKSEPTETNSETHEEISVLGQRAFDSNVRVLGFMSQTALEKNRLIESFLRNRGAICLTVPNVGHATEAEQFFQKQNVGSVTRWRDRTYLWDQVKDIPVDVRMANPFQGGNVCEDPERCEALEKKGGDPSESICPQCPVYTACQERGYLSQPAALQAAEVQIIEKLRLFLDPHYAKMVEQLIEAGDGAQPLCIINPMTEYHLFRQMFLECELSKTVLEEWRVNWQGSALGNFAAALRNAAEIRDTLHADAVRRLRTIRQTFEWLEDEIIEQMCHVNVQGRVVARGIVDTETGAELARWTIEFAQGSAAYIPVDAAAADRLAAQALPVFQLDTFVPNEDMKILIPIADAIRLGILDAATPENIQAFPTVCRDPQWTFWHQLKRFFSHYTRDIDAPIRWEDEVLRFSVPPVLHPNIKHLLVTSSVLPGEHLRQAFSDTAVEMLPIQPIAWAPGNRVFQIRTSTYSRQTIIDVNNTWDVFGISEAGQHIFWRIQAEIERNPDVKHGILVHRQAFELLEAIGKNENVCFLTTFQELKGLETDFQEAQVIWIVGMPHVAPIEIWERAQILFGNDEKPLSYEIEPESLCYKDARVQSTYEITVFRIFRKIIERAQLNRLANKTVMLITSLRVPEITDRPETLLFDWEDFDVAGGLDTLPEVIATRQQFEAERDKLTVESSRKEVERVLGCSQRQANRVLQRLRGRARITFREQILELLADGEKKTPEFAEAIQGHPKAINTELTRLVVLGEIVKVRRGVYKLPEPENPEA